MNRRSFISAALAVLVAPLAMWRKPKQMVPGVGVGYGNWRNYTCVFASVSDEEFIAKLNAAMANTTFHPPC